MKNLFVWLIVLVLSTMFTKSMAQGKILFNATKAETAGNADWIVDTDLNNLRWNPNACVNCGSNESNPQRIPTGPQANITSATPETFWDGALSGWGVDCAKRGFVVETLPYFGQITYGNASNPQDLSNYRVFVLPEPNIMFTTAEKTAIVNYIKNGGGVFLISGHSQNDRNFDGNDTPTILNDLLLNNGQANGALGFTVDAQDFSQTSSNIPFAPNDSITNGVYGSVTQVKWSGGTSMSLFPAQNATVKGVVYRTGSSGNSGVLCAYARYQKGRVAIIGDSSPADDGTGDPNDVLYFGYTGEVNGNHRRLIMNITIWLANSNSAISVNENELADNITVFPNPANDVIAIKAEGIALTQPILTDILGKSIPIQTEINSDGLRIHAQQLPNGVYYLKMLLHDKTPVTKKIIIRH